MTLDKVLDLILFGDVREQPWDVLSSRIDTRNIDMNDDEQVLRTDIAATIAANWRQGDS